MRVLILPMRNGNVGIFLLTYQGRFRSYPTYEEWKLLRSDKMENIILCSYPTYEEWKPSNNIAPSLSFNQFLSYL